MDPLSASPIMDITAQTPAAPLRVDVPVGSWDEIDGSIEPLHHLEPQEEPQRVGWLAPLIFLFGLFVAISGLVVSLLALVVVGGVGAMLWLAPTGATGMEADYIIVPETLPAQELPADDVDAEYIIVPETLPKKTRKGPSRKTSRKAAPAKSVDAGAADDVQAEYIIVPETLPVDDDLEARIKLHALPVDEAIQRVKGKAGRGEARRSKGQ